MNNMEPNEELLSAYLDGELDGDALESVEERLQTDAEFRRCFYDFRAIRESIQQLPQFELGPKFSANVLKRIEAKASERESVTEEVAETPATNPAAASQANEITSAKASSSHTQTQHVHTGRRWLPWAIGVLAASLLVGLMLPGLFTGPRNVTMAPVDSTELKSRAAATETESADAFGLELDEPTAELRAVDSDVGDGPRDRRLDTSRSSTSHPDERPLNEAMGRAAGLGQNIPSAEIPTQQSLDSIDAAADRALADDVGGKRFTESTTTAGDSPARENLAELNRARTKRSFQRVRQAETIEKAEDGPASLQKSISPESSLAWSFFATPAAAGSAGKSVGDNANTNVDLADFKAVSGGFSEDQLLELLNSPDLRQFFANDPSATSGYRKESRQRTEQYTVMVPSASARNETYVDKTTGEERSRTVNYTVMTPVLRTRTVPDTVYVPADGKGNVEIPVMKPEQAAFRLASRLSMPSQLAAGAEFKEIAEPAPAPERPAEKRDAEVESAADEENDAEGTETETPSIDNKRYVVVTTTVEAAATLLHNLDPLAKSRVALAPVSNLGKELQSNYLALSNSVPGAVAGASYGGGRVISSGSIPDSEIAGGEIAGGSIISGGVPSDGPIVDGGSITGNPFAPQAKSGQPDTALAASTANNSQLKKFEKDEKEPAAPTNESQKQLGQTMNDVTKQSEQIRSLNMGVGKIQLHELARNKELVRIMFEFPQRDQGSAAPAIEPNSAPASEPQ